MVPTRVAHSDSEVDNSATDSSVRLVPSIILITPFGWAGPKGSASNIMLVGQPKG